jgi:hypothetical protein
MISLGVSPVSLVMDIIAILGFLISAVYSVISFIIRIEYFKDIRDNDTLKSIGITTMDSDLGDLLSDSTKSKIIFSNEPILI